MMHQVGLVAGRSRASYSWLRGLGSQRQHSSHWLWEVAPPGARHSPRLVLSPYHGTIMSSGVAHDMYGQCALSPRTRTQVRARASCCCCPSCSCAATPHAIRVQQLLLELYHHTGVLHPGDTDAKRATAWRNRETHTHTHTQREREREKR